VIQGPEGGERRTAPTFWFLIEAPDAAETVAKAREIMLAVLRRPHRPVAFPERFESELPQWFTASFAPSRTAEENREYVERSRSLPPERQAEMEREQRWAAEEWFDWMHPDNRQWRWWEVQVRTTADCFSR
jgi:hypothetical protein